MEREHLMERIRAELRVSKVVALLGPKQVGKTTLARRFSGECGLPILGRGR